MAILLVQRRAYIPEYQDKRINKPDVQQMLRKVNFYKGIFSNLYLLEAEISLCELKDSVGIGITGGFYMKNFKFKLDPFPYFRKQ